MRRGIFHNLAHIAIETAVITANISSQMYLSTAKCLLNSDEAMRDDDDDDDDNDELSWLTSLSGGKRGDYQNCSVLHCVLKLRTVISTLR